MKRFRKRDYVESKEKAVLCLRVFFELKAGLCELKFSSSFFLSLLFFFLFLPS